MGYFLPQDLNYFGHSHGSLGGAVRDFWWLKIQASEVERLCAQCCFMYQPFVKPHRFGKLSGH